MADKARRPPPAPVEEEEKAAAAPGPPARAPGGPAPAPAPPAAAPAALAPAPAQQAVDKRTRKKLMKEQSDALAAQARARFRDEGDKGITIDEKLVFEYASAMSYDAFDPEIIKFKMLEITKGNAKPLIQLCLAGIYFGNNYAYRSKKAIDPNFFNDVTQTVTDYDIKRRKVDAETLTLARITQSHPWLVLQIRARLASEGILPSSGVKTSTDPLYCDPALAPLSGILQDRDLVDFLEAFAEALKKFEWRSKNSKPKDAEKIDQEIEEAVDRMHQFRELAVSAWSKDKHHTGIDLTTVNTVAKEVKLLGYNTGFT